jgi:hypothetical protein
VLLFCCDSAKYDDVVECINIVESQVEYFQGMRTSLRHLVPNKTHQVNLVEGL